VGHRVCSVLHARHKFEHLSVAWCNIQLKELLIHCSVNILKHSGTCMSLLSDFRPLPPCTWDLRPSVMLRSVYSYLPTFRENLLVPSSRVKQPKWNCSIAWPLKREPCRMSWNDTNLRCVTWQRAKISCIACFHVQNVRISPTERILLFSGYPG
jgi:hypothetical protein